MSILTLPPEIIEQVLISTAAAGFPHAIAAFAQTSKSNHALVYDTKDQHLWREVFLTTFDDPRASGGGPGWGECVSSKSDTHKEDAFDWGAEFRRRIWAAGYLRRETDPERKLRDEEYVTELEVTHRNIRAFDAILSVISTALPCPPTIVFSFLPPPGSTSDAHTPLAPTSNYPTFPPLPQAIGGFTNSILTVGPTDTSGRTFSQALRANSIGWLTSVLAKGLPPQITAFFSGEKWPGGLAGQYLDEPQFREMQTAGHIMACTGFIPIPPELVPAVSPPELISAEGSCASGASSAKAKTPYMSVERQLKRARRLARMRVYNMRYLSRDSDWGPFLPCEPKQGRKTRAMSDDDALLQPILALFSAHRHAQHEGTDEDEGEEEEDVGMRDDGERVEEDSHSDDEMMETEVGADEEAIEDDEDDPENIRPLSPPSAAELRADWAYLAAVRVVVEANLRESFQAADLRGLFSLDGLRRGSAPWDAAAYKPCQSTDEAPVGHSKGKERATGSDDAEGWDWAGVTGVWMRCVCWMDYRDLILHNLSGEFEGPHLSEAVRVVSMRLRIKSYSPCNVPGYTHLPTIHIMGETLGSAIPTRKIHGTVSMIGDGSVRWTTYSTVEGGNADEWVSEGVQVGGVASAMGVLGLWTGAQHERMDPLGPCWAWKVG